MYSACMKIVAKYTKFLDKEFVAESVIWKPGKNLDCHKHVTFKPLDSNPLTHIYKLLYV